MKKKRIIKIIGIILIIILIFIAIHTIRNTIIISDLQNKIDNYSNSTNYYTKSVATESNGTVVTMEYYKKDKKEVVFLERNLKYQCIIMEKEQIHSGIIKKAKQLN